MPAPRIHTSEFPPVETPTTPIWQTVLAGAADRGDHPALLDGVSGQTVSYAQLAHMVDRMAAGFAENGVRPGDVVALHSPNTVLYPVVFYAASRAGATVTTLSALTTAKDMAVQLDDGKATLVITVGALLPVATEAAGDRPVWTCDRVEGHRSVQELLASTGPAPEVAVDAAEDVAVLPYSSGTTSLPKGVMLTHASIGVNLAQIDALHTMGTGDRIVAVLPFFHIYGMTVLMNVALRKGATVVVLPRFDLAQFIDVLEQHRITRAYVAPPVVLAMAKHPAFEGRDFSALTFILSAAAPLDAELGALAARRMGAELGQAYGMTELSPGTHLVPDGTAHDAPAGTIGKLFPSTEARLVDPGTGEDVGFGEPGEIWIRGPQRMKGYFGRQEETDTLIDADGWHVFQNGSSVVHLPTGRSLSTALGANNVRAEATADVDFSRSEQAAEIYKPNGSPDAASATISDSQWSLVRLGGTRAQKPLSHQRSAPGLRGTRPEVLGLKNPVQIGMRHRPSNKLMRQSPA